MTQQQQLDSLNSIMPDIVSTGNPKKVMLKYARQHNLSPAQLERLGHVFNTAKHLVGLEKQANRGDSFTIVDVPAMLSEYTSYNPEADLDTKSQEAHKQVNKIIKGASFTNGMHKNAATNEIYYDSYESINRLPSVYTGVDRRTCESATLKKEATTKEAPVTKEQLEKTAQDMQFARQDCGFYISEKCAAVQLALTPDDGRWQEAAEDIIDNLGEKGEEVVAQVEEYFQKNAFVFTPYKKKSYTDNYFAEDRHRILKYAEVLSDSLDMYKELAETERSLHESINLLEKTAAESSLVSSITMQDLLDSMGKQTLTSKNIREQRLKYEKDRQAVLDKAIADAASQSTIQQLMLEDPVIREADPEQVKQLYKAITDMSPNMTQNAVKLAPVLREALQYGSLPIQTVLDLQKSEQNDLNIKNLRNEIGK